MPIWTSLESTRPEPERITMDGGMGFWRSLAVLGIVIALTVIPLKAVGSEAEFDCGAIACDRFENPELAQQQGRQLDKYELKALHNASRQRGVARRRRRAAGRPGTRSRDRARSSP